MLVNEFERFLINELEERFVGAGIKCNYVSEFQRILINELEEKFVGAC
jgi:hypothetical protein